MKPFHEYWTFSAIRGTMTLLAAVAILTVPQAASSMLSISVLIGLAINCLAAYSVLDAGVMVLLSKLLPVRATNVKPLYAQAFMAILTGTLLFMVVYGSISIHWLMWIAAGQAAFAAAVEFTVAHQTHREYGCFSCYATTLVLAVSALCLPFAAGLTATGMSLALAAYVGAYGSSELLLGARMLFLEYRGQHPAKTLSEAWRVEMFTPPVTALLSLKARKISAAMTCAVCPAAPLCLDSSLTAQLAAVLAERVPAIVRSSRIETMRTTAVQPVAA